MSVCSGCVSLFLSFFTSVVLCDGLFLRGSGCEKFRGLKACFVVIDYVLEVWRRLKEYAERFKESRVGEFLVRVWKGVRGVFELLGLIMVICGVLQKVGIEIWEIEQLIGLIRRLITYLHEPVVQLILSDAVLLLVIAELYFRIDRRLERLEQTPTVKTSSQTKVAYLQCTRLRCEIDDSERCRCVFRLSCEYMTPYGCPHRCAFLTLERAPPSGAGAFTGGVLGAILGGIVGGPLGSIGGFLLGLSIGNSLEASQAPIKETDALRKYKECERRGCLVVFEIVV